VLYSTNAIFLGRAKLIDALLKSTDLSQGPTIPPSVLPTAHLARITRLEIAWNWPLATLPIHSDKQAAARTHMAESLVRIARADAFPRLTSLVLSYGDSLYQRPEPPQKCLDDLDAALLNPLRAMTAAFWKGRQKKITRQRKDGECGRDAPILQLTVELPTNTFDPLYERTIRCGGVFDLGASYFHRRFWWLSVVKMDNAGMPIEGYEEEDDTEENEMDPDKCNGRCYAVDCGFWVRAGIESQLNFDYQGNPFRMNTTATCF
jgi:hypothetical protein